MEPIRAEGPTPNGGDYSVLYPRGDGTCEIVEFKNDGTVVRRTYGFYRDDGTDTTQDEESDGPHAAD